MLLSIIWHLEGQALPGDRAATGYHAYSAVLAALEAVAPTAVRRCRADEGPRLLTVSSPCWLSDKRPAESTAHHDSSLFVRLTSVDAEVTAALLEIAHAPSDRNRLLRLADSPFVIAKCDSNRGPWVSQTTHAELWASARPCRSCRMQFASPTTFRAVTGTPRPMDLPLPIPERCVGSWLRAWSATAPPGLAFDEEPLLIAARLALTIGEHRLKTQMADLGKFQAPGFVGQVRFVAPHGLPPEVARQLDCLSRFALFCGTGRKVAMGMGQTRRLHAAGDEHAKRRRVVRHPERQDQRTGP